MGLGDWADPKWIGKTVQVHVTSDRKSLSMKIVKEFPHTVREIPHLDIPSARRHANRSAVVAAR